MKKATLSLFVFAFMLRPLMAAPMPEAADLLPGQMNAAGFVNVRSILRDYGMLFDGGPLAAQLDQFVAMGLPDPRKEIDQIGFGGTIEALDDDEFVVVTTGSLRVDRLIEFGAMQSGGSISEEAYRGVTLLGLTDPETSAIQVKAANLTENTAMGSFDRKGLHPYARLLVETAQGQNVSYGEKYESAMSADDYVMLAAELPKSLRKQMEEWDQFAFLSLITHVRGSLRKVGENVRLQLDGVCMDMFDAETVKRALQKVAEYAQERFDDPEFQEIIQSIEFSRSENTTTVSVQLPEEMLQDLLGGLTGNDSEAAE